MARCYHGRAAARTWPVITRALGVRCLALGKPAAAAGRGESALERCDARGSVAALDRARLLDDGVVRVVDPGVEVEGAGRRALVAERDVEVGAVAGQRILEAGI